MKQSVLVIGLGRFGSSAALELMRLGHDGLAVDRDEATVNDIAPEVTHDGDAKPGDHLVVCRGEPRELARAVDFSPAYVTAVVRGVAAEIATLEATRYELFRALGGRRSERQVRAMTWTGDVEAFVTVLTPYAMPVHDLIETAPSDAAHLRGATTPDARNAGPGAGPASGLAG